MTGLAEIALAYILGAAIGAVLWRASGDLFAVEAFRRTNYRGHPLPTAAGVLLAVAGGLAVAVHVLVLDSWHWAVGDTDTEWRLLAIFGPATVQLAVAFALLGLFDDLGGAGQSGGFRGHLGALAKGRLTTGSIKLLGGPVFALAVLAGTNHGASRVGLLRDVVLICLAANLANLFDRAPGRVNKVGQLAFLVLAAVTLSGRLSPIAIIMGAAAALLRPDLDESMMLGDAGSNVIGAVIGYGVVITADTSQRWIVLVALLVLNLASEFVSFSSVIDSNRVLRRLDRLGSPHR